MSRVAHRNLRLYVLGCDSCTITLLKLQKRTARLILDQDPTAPSEPLFKQLGWMSIEQRIKYPK
jgi:hypothetical protein